MVILITYIVGFIVTWIGFKLFDPFIEGEWGLNENWERCEISKKEHDWSQVSFSLAWPFTLIGLFVLLVCGNDTIN